MIRQLVRLALVALFVACNKTKEPPPSQVNLAPTPSAKPVDLGPEPNVDLSSLPTQEQYEEEAEKAITPKNLVQKVDELEKEVLAK